MSWGFEAHQLKVVRHAFEAANAFCSPEPLSWTSSCCVLIPEAPAGPALLAEPGVGPVLAAQLLVSWSHRGRVHNEGAFASLAGVAPFEASSGQRTPAPAQPNGRPKSDASIRREVPVAEGPIAADRADERPAAG